MKKIKIYIFHPYSRIGGADLSLSRLINNLNSNKYSITFITLAKPKISFYLNKKIEICILKKKRAFFSVFDLRSLVKKNRQNYSKIIFISNQNFANIISVLATLKLKWLKLILIERNNPVELDYSKTFKSKLIKLLIKITYKFSDIIIAISKELSNDLEKLCNKKVTTIYNPAFDKNIFKIAKKKIKKPKYKIILNVARFEKQKNHQMLLKSFKNINSKLNAKLILVGYGEEKSNILNFIKKNNLQNKIKVIHNNKDVYKYYKISDLFVLTSLYEGFGNVLVEAGMFKIPIISTNCKSGPKEILNNGKYGDLVNINDNNKLTYLILKNLYKKNKKKISLMYNSLYRFNIKNHISKYEKIFEKI